MTARGWFLFSLMGVVWGIPYLLIKVAVDASLSPSMVVFTRCALGGGGEHLGEIRVDIGVIVDDQDAVVLPLRVIHEVDSCPVDQGLGRVVGHRS